MTRLNRAKWPCSTPSGPYMLPTSLCAPLSTGGRGDCTTHGKRLRARQPVSIKLPGGYFVRRLPMHARRSQVNLRCGKVAWLLLLAPVLLMMLFYCEVCTSHATPSYSMCQCFICGVHSPGQVPACTSETCIRNLVSQWHS